MTCPRSQAGEWQSLIQARDAGAPVVISYSAVQVHVIVVILSKGIFTQSEHSEEVSFSRRAVGTWSKVGAKPRLPHHNGDGESAHKQGN